MSEVLESSLFIFVLASFLFARIPFNAFGAMGNLGRRFPGPATVERSSQVNLNLAPCG